MLRQNPPWTDNILRKHWDRIEAAVGHKWMPVPVTEHKSLKELREALYRGEQNIFISKQLGDDYLHALDTQAVTELRAQIKALEKRKKNLGYTEYGCGHYGCVMPTNTSGVVVKVTTDPTEAAFVAAYLSLPSNKRPSGIIPYHGIKAIPGGSYKRRNVYILWREEAQHVGHLAIARAIGTDPYHQRSLEKTLNLMQACKQRAHRIRELVRTKSNQKDILSRAVKMMDEVWELQQAPSVRGNPIAHIAWLLHDFDQKAEAMLNEPMGYYIGQALRECLDLGLLLADVHGGNIGLPTGPLLDQIGNTAIITDPGHAVALDTRYDGITIQEI